MDPIIGGALIGGGASLLGSWFSSNKAASSTASANKASLQSTREQIAFQKEEAERARAYQTGMSNTAYQRAIADMKAAGLNPMLAFQQGGASTPSSPSPSGASYQAQADKSGEIMGEGISKAAQAGLGVIQARNFHEQNKLLGEQVDYTASQTLQTNAQAKSLELQTAYKDAIYKTILSNPEMLANAAATEAGSPTPLKYAQAARGVLDTPIGKRAREVASSSAKAYIEAPRKAYEKLEELNNRYNSWAFKTRDKARKYVRDVFTRGKPIYTSKRKN